jgi:hypothetical protein
LFSIVYKVKKKAVKTAMVNPTTQTKQLQAKQKLGAKAKRRTAVKHTKTKTKTKTKARTKAKAVSANCQKQKQKKTRPEISATELKSLGKVLSPSVKRPSRYTSQYPQLPSDSEDDADSDFCVPPSLLESDCDSVPDTDSDDMYSSQSSEDSDD